MFYTPGWGAVLTLTGTLGGVLITQLVNSAVSRGTRRRERNQRVTESVGDLIAGTNAWIDATSTYEWDMLWLVKEGGTSEQQAALLEKSTPAIYAARLEFRRTLARVRLTSPAAVASAAESAKDAMSAYQKAAFRNAQVAQEVGSVDEVKLTESDDVGKALERLVQVTRKATGYPHLSDEGVTAQGASTGGSA